MRVGFSFIIALILLSFHFQLHAQNHDFGAWGSLSAQKSIGDLNLGAEAEIRTQDNASKVDRLSLQLSVNYDLIKQVKVGIGYELMDYYDSKYDDYQLRHRFIVYVTGKQKWGDFTFSLRERAQVTTKDESDRIRKSGKIDTYKINPEWTWRNRVKVEYNIPHCRLTPSFSFETFYQLNNPDGNVFDKIRYTITLEYKLSKQHQLEVYSLMNKEINVSDPLTNHVIGAGYAFSF